MALQAKAITKPQGTTRRTFLASTAAAFLFPAIVPSSVFGQNAPSNRITLGCIGVGRMGRDDMREFMTHADVQVVAVCDVDSKRRENAKKLVEDKYAKESPSGTYKGCGAYNDFRELLARDDIDAVSIVTPDHWHAIPAIAAAKAGKDIFLQKPLTLTVREGRVLSDVVRKANRVFQTGSQQRSEKEFLQACELVRNKRIGELKTVQVGFAADPSCGIEPDMPVPENLDYDFWLGPAPVKPYTEKRVHPQANYDRPGWLRIRDYSGGMMTGWGSHHIDIAQWGMGLMGPLTVEGHAEYPKNSLWDVHGPFRCEYTYANGITMIVTDQNETGARFEGTEGWVFVTRGKIMAEPASLLTSTIGPNEIHLYESVGHKRNFLDCIKSREETVAPVENAHRSCTSCLLGNIAMELGRKVTWDQDKEQFVNDAEADKLLSREMRGPWTLEG